MVDALCSAGATDVVAGVRRPSPRLERVPVKLVHCDLMDRESLETDPYGEEQFAEEKLCQAAAGPDLTVAVVRPSLVYGPFGDFWTGRFIEGIAPAG